MAITAKDCYALVSYFEKQYKDKYGTPPTVNKYRARYGMEAVLMSMPSEEGKELINYYLTTNSTNRHSIDWFFNNYDKLVSSFQTTKKDAERRERLRAESEQRAREWKARVGHQGISNN